MDFIEKRNEPYEQPTGSEPTRIVAAAILQNGRVWTGKRHGLIIPIVFKDTGEKVTQDQQGFWTDDNRFVRRVAAMTIALEHGQVVKGKTINSRDLFSEDLW